MRVGLVLERFDPLRGGLEQWTFRFADRLIARGHEVHVVAREFSRQGRGLPIVAHPLPPVRSPLALAEAAEDTLVPLDLEVIHDMGVGWHCDIFHPHGGSRVAATQRRLVLSPRWLRPLKRCLDRISPRRREFQLLTERQYTDRGQLHVAVSQAVADELQRFHGIARQQIRVVHNGVDTQRFSPARCAAVRESARRRLGIGRETVLALIVAHNFRLKGVPTLLRALRRLRAADRPVHLVVVGGRHLARWRRQAQWMGIGRAVTFAGVVEDTLPYYAAADLYVHPTFSDPCSLVVLEAAACGLPLVTSRRDNGVAELLAEGVEGLLLSDPADDEELAVRMLDLFDEAKRKRLGDAVRRMAARHTFEHNVDNILAVYREIVAARRTLAGGPSVWSGKVRAASSNGPAAGRRGLRETPPERHAPLPIRIEGRDHAEIKEPLP